ncbi:MAG: 1-(5-phosphoribosyl)-5-[(5-phosphoribosylamino)methylideneamino]imidazole-4-carboxamide isomerase [Candidatus Altiarchaeales archaeon]|nr:1-(5-phosphoribosyl)-5-[(5-phosphoribosylamino)methylideneamino]imidazole-4-carboxamide isomerase [Candidatus Altiarchaeota archaeon]MBU4437545.1 1-(5-phosphoribosyl)-5-[(5-phosphoribosylamino)methylideneamino]imidazole-4-carboxamide isomerase [Candidatus Altiarchaeota archaeon]MCG2783369.1 1-(5-phosphoribosyl)-5-[(5-phosphoribosylamino)methylideneamino]imidazole-4-carboxamide isomerase [Candidatus Altiarchaeales archaeon]
MKIIPAVDIMDGECVQLVGGNPDTKKSYGNPVDMAKRWVSQGAKMLHVVDLDAALGRGDNTETVMDIAHSVDVPIQLGGGIRSMEKAEFLLNSDIGRIILGTLAINDYFNEFKILKELNRNFGDRVIAAVDSKDGNMVVKGWQEKTKLKAQDFMKKADGLVWGFLYTDVNVEGRMEGINISSIETVLSSTKKPVIISGGISNEKDIRILDDVGVWGIVLGKALYEGRIKL